MAHRTFPLLVILLGWAGPVAANEPLLTVRATDAATGRPLAALSCSLVRPAKNAPYARFDGTSYAVGPAPRAGDRLHVFCRGYDLAVAVLAEDARRVEVALTPAAGRCSVRVEGTGVAASTITFEVDVRAPGPRGREPLRARYTVAGRGARHELVVPGRAVVSVSARARPGLVAPLVFEAEAGATRTLRYEAPRPLAVRRAGSFRLDAARVEVLPDLLWKPEAAPALVDAWRLRLNRPGWLRDAIAGDAETIGVVPDVPFHLFASWQGRGVYRYVARGTKVLDLGAPGPVRSITARPVVDGKPAPAGAWLAPGRLDLYSAATLGELPVALDGCVVLLEPVADGWTPVTLPAADWLTLWHEEHGVAHLRWTDDGAPAGKLQPCRIVVEPAPGHDAQGSVSAFPVWRGAGSVTTIPPERPLRRPLRGAAPVEFRGLPPGRYGLRLRFTSIERRTGRARRIVRTVEIEVPAARPHVRHRLPAR